MRLNKERVWCDDDDDDGSLEGDYYFNIEIL